MIWRSLLMLALLGAPLLVASGCGGGAPDEGVMEGDEPEPELTEEEVAGEEEYIESQRPQ